jgi:hypothetical protein
MIQRVNFINRGSMQNMFPLPNWAAISISEGVKTRLHHGWYASYHSCFDDADPAKPFDGPKTLMNAVHADEIVAFVESVAPHVEIMFVNCMGGISRSAAVALWIAERFDLPFDRDYTLYNHHVYGLMCEAGLRFENRNHES